MLTPCRRSAASALVALVSFALMPDVSRADDAVHLPVTRHVLGLFQGVPGARAWRQYLSAHAHRPGAGVEVLRAAAAQVSRGAAEQPRA